MRGPAWQVVAKIQPLLFFIKDKPLASSSLVFTPQRPEALNFLFLTPSSGPAKSSNPKNILISGRFQSSPHTTCYYTNAVPNCNNMQFKVFQIQPKKTSKIFDLTQLQVVKHSGNNWYFQLIPLFLLINWIIQENHYN